MRYAHAFAAALLLAVVFALPGAAQAPPQQSVSFTISGEGVSGSGEIVADCSTSAPESRSFTLAGDDLAGSGAVTVTVECPTPPPPPPDTEAPSEPSNHRQVGATKTSATVAWNASTDNVGVDHYNLWIAGSLAGTTSALEFTYENLPCGTSWSGPGLEAVDAAGNISTRSHAPISTLPCADPPPPPPPPVQCADGVDNDNDGKIDLADPGCANAQDNDESDDPPPPPPPPPPPGQDGDWRIEGVRVYGSVSYWEKDVRGAPLDAQSDEFVAFWNSKAGNKGINLVGDVNGGIGSYSFATCYGRAGDPVWTLSGGNPSGSFQMRCAPNNGGNLSVAGGDSELQFFDLVAGKAMRITGSCNQSARTCTSVRNFRDWTESDADAGLDHGYNPSCAQCLGHRGLDTNTFGFRYAEAAAGLIPHAVKMTLPSVVNSSGFVFPYVGGEGGKSGIVPEGMRVRLKQAAYDRLKAQPPFSSNGAARAMLDGLYRYGSTTSDSGGSGINMKLENGNGLRWADLGISNQSLAGVKITDFEFVQRGWGR